ncbi:MAG: family 65 glycosyl hydrolase [Lachnospiraceae bacterium]|nr:family 65 glycosyl hydrolase [Lachnospiraceae bacterium]
MAKAADKYFETDPWKIVEDGFDPAYAMTAESVFSLGNEYMGVRGYFEEGYGREHLLGSYFNGVYDRKKTETQGYKGIVQESEFMVNSVDWLYLRLEADGEVLDLAVSDFEDFHRELDLRSGLLTRQFIWKTKSGRIELNFERLISMVHNAESAQRVSIRSLDYEGTVRVKTGLDFDTVHESDKKLWDCSPGDADNGYCHIVGITRHTDMKVGSFCLIRGSLTETADAIPVTEDKKAVMLYSLNFTSGSEATMEKTVINQTPLAGDLTDPADRLGKMTFDSMLEENRSWWKEVWLKSDIEIRGDEENQQGIRFCIFQMFQTYHGAVKGTNIGAKGLTGEAYNGNAFWDTETYCLPFFLFHDRVAARNLLYFRYATLDEARKRAKSLDCEGAFYPIATISGRECCNLWQHASLQLQASTAVAYGIRCYETITGDREFLYDHGLEMLTEISRMLATRGDYNRDHTSYGYYCVMGPDEFQMMVNNNCYTNYMGRFALDYTLDSLKRVREEAPEVYKRVVDKTGLKEEELIDWQEKSEAMYIPFDEATGLYEQHEGFFRLPHIDVDEIPTADFPLYHHWSYDRIYRNDMIKQPDVLMFLLLFNSSFTEDIIRRNYEYYEPLCIHESSLSPSVHSILAEQIGKEDEAYDFFRFATRMDLDNYNRNSGEGLHTTSIAAAWMNIVYGFGGLRSDGELISFNPHIPSKWEGYSFRVVYKDEVICVNVDKKRASFHTLGGKSIDVIIGKEKVTLNNEDHYYDL